MADSLEYHLQQVDRDREGLAEINAHIEKLEAITNDR